MTDLDPLSQLQVESEIQRLSGELGALTVHMRLSFQRAAQADVEFKRAVARKWIELRGHSGTVPEKEAEVADATAEQYQQWKLDEAVAKADRESGLNLRSQLAALQTIAANQRHAIDYSHGRGD